VLTNKLIDYCDIGTVIGVKCTNCKMKI